MTLPENKISLNALKVLRRLQEHGYQSYLVGGGVRDLILGKEPKDFDIATDAHPEEVRDLFRNSRTIGRRFKIVHVRFGREIIEVATFRASNQDPEPTHQTESGRLLSDNVYGTFKEDVFRRDFTINALYYSPPAGEVIDLVDGQSDIESRRLRLIGDPEERIREDPVRMLRAVRFKSQLGFEIEPGMEQVMSRLGYLIQDIPAARLFEEVLKLFMHGCGKKAFEDLLRYELFGWLFPDSRRSFDDYPTETLISAALESTDTRIANELPVTPAFIFGALLWYPFVSEKADLEEEGASTIEASNEAAINVVGKQQLFTSLPRRFSGPMRDIWQLQYRLPVRFGKKPDLLMEHKRFRAAYDFLLLREVAGEQTEELGDWWTRYQEADKETQQSMKQSADRPRRRRRRSRSRKPSNP